MKDQLHRYQGRRVEVRAHGIVYRGVFVGTDEEFLYLKGETTWISLLLEAVTGVRKEGESEREWVLKPIAGEPERPKDLDRKRRYNLADLEKLYLQNLACDWPETDDCGESKEGDLESQ